MGPKTHSGSWIYLNDEKYDHEYMSNLIGIAPLSEEKRFQFLNDFLSCVNES